MSQVPYVYISPAHARDFSRNLPEGGRIAVHFPEAGACVELHVDPRGGFAVLVGPSAGESGEFRQILSYDFDDANLIGGSD